MYKDRNSTFTFDQASNGIPFVVKPNGKGYLLEVKNAGLGKNGKKIVGKNPVRETDSSRGIGCPIGGIP